MSAGPVILLVCTGNTCRSPMAAALLRHMLCERGFNVSGASQANPLALDDGPFTVRSAGVGVACPGQPASKHALTAMEELGISLASHAATPVSAEQLVAADLILTMTWAHKELLMAQFAEAAQRVFTLAEYNRQPGEPAPDIADPIGGDLERYRACAAQLEQELSKLVEQISVEQISLEQIPVGQIPSEEAVGMPPHTETPPRPPLLEIPIAGVEPGLGQVVLPRLAIGADHAGYQLKNELAVVAVQLGCDVTDYGTDGASSVDYPDFAALVAKAVACGQADAGVLVCGSGLGMAIAANKIRGIRAVTVNDLYCARMAREHNDANILSLGARVVGPGLATEILRIFLTTSWGANRHTRRVRKIADLERDRK